MPLSDFNFNPSEGLRNVTEYPSKPGSGTEAREQVQGRLDEIKTYLNNEVKVKVEESETSLATHLADLLQHMFGMVGYYKVTEFDTPSAGDITETIKKTADNSTFATLITEFDTPTAGDITKTLNCPSLSINHKIVTEFDTPTAGDIKQTVSEVV